MTDQPEEKPPLTKADIIKSIGEALAKRRHVRNVTLERVYESTKIRPVIIEALEKGNWNELPGDVYIRGFVIRYAQFLGMNGQELINPYLEVVHHLSHAPAVKEQEPQDQQHARFGWLIGLAGLILLGVIFKFIGSYIRSRSSAMPPVTVSTIAPTTVAVSTEPVTDEPMEPSKHRLQVFSPNELWLRVTTEKKNFEGFIPQGSTWAFEGEGTFTLRLGHMREVNILFDGKTVVLAENQKKVVLPHEN